MTTDETERIMSMELEAAYKNLCAEAVDKPELDEIKHLARYGELINFDLYYYFERHHVIKRRSDQIIIGNIVMSLNDFWTELEQREALIKRNLLQLVDGGDIVKPRDYHKPHTITHMEGEHA